MGRFGLYSSISVLVVKEEKNMWCLKFWFSRIKPTNFPPQFQEKEHKIRVRALKSEKKRVKLDQRNKRTLQSGPEVKDIS